MIDIFSVVLYTIAFFISILLFHYSESEIKWKQSLCAGLAILILCLLAGLRDNSVGRDVNVYVSNYFSLIDRMPSIQAAMKVTTYTELEPLYVIFLFLTSRIANDAWLALFMLQFLTIFPVYLAVRKCNQNYRISIAFSMAVYIFCFFNNSLNIMRQSVSAAFILLGTVYLLDYLDRIKRSENAQSKGRFILILAIFAFALLFHKSAFLGIVFVALSILLYKVPRGVLLMVPVAALFIYIFLIPIFHYLVSVIDFSSSFLFYIDVFIFKTQKTSWMLDGYTNALLFDFMFRSILVLTPFFVPKIYCKEDRIFRNITFFGYIVYSFMWLTMTTIYGNRLATFSDFFLIVLVPFILDRKLKPKMWAHLFVYILMYIYWFIWIIIVGWSDSSLYVFRF